MPADTSSVASSAPATVQPSAETDAAPPFAVTPNSAWYFTPCAPDGAEAGLLNGNWPSSTNAPSPACTAAWALRASFAVKFSAPGLLARTRTAMTSSGFEATSSRV